MKIPSLSDIADYFFCYRFNKTSPKTEYYAREFQLGNESLKMLNNLKIFRARYFFLTNFSNIGLAVSAYLSIKTHNPLFLLLIPYVESARYWGHRQKKKLENHFSNEIKDVIKKECSHSFLESD